jgi:predicted nucleic acid-binding Zn ribbon protein
MGRRSPRPISEALGAFRAGIQPPGLLGRLQAEWEGLVGPAIARVAQPTSEREGVVTIECTDSIWAEELNLMREDLLQRIREALGEQAPAEIRFRRRIGPDS